LLLESFKPMKKRKNKKAVIWLPFFNSGSLPMKIL